MTTETTTPILVTVNVRTRPAAACLHCVPAGERTITINLCSLSTEQREELARSENRGILDVSQWGEYLGDLPALLDAHRSCREKEEAEKKAEISKRIEDFRAKSIDERIENLWGQCREVEALPEYKEAYDERQRRRAEQERAEAEAKALRLEKARIEAEEKAKRDAIKDETDRIARDYRKAWLADWISENADSKVVELQRRGLLANDTALDILRDRVFEQINLSRYEKLTKDDVVHTDEYCNGGTGFYVDDSTSATVEQLEVILQIESALTVESLSERFEESDLSNASVVLREHRAYCDEDDCEDVTKRSSILATITVGGWTLSREYAT